MKAFVDQSSRTEVSGSLPPCGQTPLATLIERATIFHPWDAMSPSALWAIADRALRAPFDETAETGCGGSTIVLSHLSQRHTAFALDGENHTASELKRRGDLAPNRVTFIEGETQRTLPAFKFQATLDLILLDGPHAYPLPQVEFTYLFPHLRTGGWLVIDDVQIPSVHQLFRYLKSSRAVDFEEVVGRTAFFRRAENRDEAVPGPDGWWLQEMNRSLVWRYSWRDRMRKLLRGRAGR